MLKVSDVYKLYENNEVLHGISLCVNPGEIYGLIGEKDFINCVCFV